MIRWKCASLNTPADVQRVKEGRLRGGDWIGLVRCMMQHDDRVTWQCRIDGTNTLVAVKAFADIADREMEASCYEKLTALQGVSIPTLLDKDFRFHDDRYCFGLVLSWVGEEFGGNYLTLPKGALLEAQAVVLKMHERGVVHRDLRPENMNYNFTTGRLFLYDFSHGATRQSLGDAAFEQARRDDCDALKGHLEGCETPHSRKLLDWVQAWLRAPIATR